MFYTSDFKVHPLRLENVKENPETRKPFSVLLNNEKNNNYTLPKYSIAKAAKPFVYTLGLCGIHILSYRKNELQKATILQKIHCAILIISLIILRHYAIPTIIQQTIGDIPLYILSTAQSYLYAFESLYFITILTFKKSGNFVKLFQTLDEIDSHFGTSKKIYRNKLYMAIFLTLLPFMQTCGFFFFKKIDASNATPYLFICMPYIQSIMMYFFTVNIYLKYIIMNRILLSKIKSQKILLYKETIADTLRKVLFADAKFADECAKGHYCWFELMQIYDKITDCLRIFNQIFTWQILIMFNIRLTGTLITICRNISPVVKKKNTSSVWSDLYVYTNLCLRPFFLAYISGRFNKEHNKTVTILLQALVYGNSPEYYHQITSMLELVTTKKMLISAKVFSVNIPVVLNFFAQAISFTVLMIQYFYLHQLSQ